MKCLVYITHKMNSGLYPTHYIQVTGVYDEKGVTFWHWGKDNNHSTNVDTYFIFKIQKP